MVARMLNKCALGGERCTNLYDSTQCQGHPFSRLPRTTRIRSRSIALQCARRRGAHHLKGGMISTSTERRFPSRAAPTYPRVAQAPRDDNPLHGGDHRGSPPSLNARSLVVACSERRSDADLGRDRRRRCGVDCASFPCRSWVRPKPDPACARDTPERPQRASRRGDVGHHRGLLRSVRIERGVSLVGAKRTDLIRWNLGNAWVCVTDRAHMPTDPRRQNAGLGG